MIPLPAPHTTGRYMALLAAVLVVALALQYVMVGQDGPHVVTRPQNQFQENFMSGMHYLYGDRSTYKTVVLGSSMARMICNDSTPDIYNLSFKGQSLLDGVRILNHLPPPAPGTRILMEYNLANRGPKEIFQQALFDSPMRVVRRRLPGTRDEHQPASYAGVWMVDNIIAPVLYRVHGGLLKYRRLYGDDADTQEKSKAEDEAAHEENNQRMFDASRVAGIGAFARLDSGMLERNITEIIACVARLENAGCRVGLFYMPGSVAVCDLPNNLYTRQRVLARMPPSRYTYIPTNPCGTYLTKDGVHITADEVPRFEASFRPVLDSVFPLR